MHAPLPLIRCSDHTHSEPQLPSVKRRAPFLFPLMMFLNSWLEVRGERLDGRSAVSELLGKRAQREAPRAIKVSEDYISL